MKILNVNTHMDLVTGGGGAERTFQMSRYLSKYGHKCTILTTDYRLSNTCYDKLDNVELISFPCMVDRFFIPIININEIIKLVECVDIIHLMAHWSLLNTIVYYAAKHVGKPYVVCPVGTLPIYGRSRLLKLLYNYFVGRKIIQNANALIAVTSDEIPQLTAYSVKNKKIVTWNC